MKTNLETSGAYFYLSEPDWNFDAVPDNELVACCYWEYARESAFVRNTLQKYREWCLSGSKWSDCDPEIGKNLEKIQSMGYTSEVFVRGVTLLSREACQSIDPQKPNYRHPDAPVLTANFPNPWLSLSKDERKSRSHIRNARSVIPAIPFKRASWHDAKDIADWAESRWHEFNKLYDKARRESPGLSEKELVEKGKMQEFRGIQPSLFWEGGSEVTVVSIQWSLFSNDELARYFRDWIKANRPKHFKNPDARGHKLNDWRAKLTRLAVMRLLSQFSASQIVSGNRFPAIWETTQFSGSKWADFTKWYDARREARKIFNSLLPFVPQQDKPLSWQRQAPGK